MKNPRDRASTLWKSEVLSKNQNKAPERHLWSARQTKAAFSSGGRKAVCSAGSLSLLALQVSSRGGKLQWEPEQGWMAPARLVANWQEREGAMKTTDDNDNFSEAANQATSQPTNQHWNGSSSSKSSSIHSPQLFLISRILTPGSLAHRNTHRVSVSQWSRLKATAAAADRAPKFPLALHWWLSSFSALAYPHPRSIKAPLLVSTSSEERHHKRLPFIFTLSPSAQQD